LAIASSLLQELLSKLIKMNKENSNLPNSIEGRLGITLPRIQWEARGRVRSNLAVHHLMAAAYYARKSGELESEHAGKTFGGFWDEILWNVSASVLFGIAALEADANEIFSYPELSFPEYDSQLIDQIWTLVEMESILDKYDMALFLKKKQHLDKGASAYQEADNLIKLRNALMHFKPEWHDEKKAHKKIEQRLIGRFALSPFLPDDAEFFPMKCMSHGCAEWAVRTTLAFRAAFSADTGLEDKFAPSLLRLSTK
jgi:hypothetical protein